MRLRSGKEPNKERKVFAAGKNCPGRAVRKLAQLRLQLAEDRSFGRLLLQYGYLQSDAKITFRMEKRFASSNILIHSHLLTKNRRYVGFFLSNQTRPEQPMLRRQRLEVPLIMHGAFVAPRVVFQVKLMVVLRVEPRPCHNHFRCNWLARIPLLPNLLLEVLRDL